MDPETQAKVIAVMNGHRDFNLKILARMDTDWDGWFPDEVFQAVRKIGNTVSDTLVERWLYVGLLGRDNGSPEKWRVAYRGKTAGDTHVFLVDFTGQGVDLPVRRVAIREHSQKSGLSVKVHFGPEEVDAIDWWIERGLAATPDHLYLRLAEGTAYRLRILREYP